MSISSKDGATKRDFILASTSPRRSELLEAAGYNFDIVAPDVDEESFEKAGVAPIKLAELLAFEKALSVGIKFPAEWVLGADTVVDFKGEIIGKAKNAAEAERITRKLFSEPHEVVTGVALVRVCEGTEIVKSVSTIVYPRRLTEEQILGHVNGLSWEGKAGAYGIQESGDEFVERIDGSFTNVMGLPMELVRELLDKYLK